MTQWNSDLSPPDTRSRPSSRQSRAAKRAAGRLLPGIFVGAFGFTLDPGESKALADLRIDDLGAIVHECSDGIDNDGDSRTDYPDAPDCADASG